MNNRKSYLAAFLVIAAFSGPRGVLSQSKTCEVAVDFSRPQGFIRHLNDVNGGPLCVRGWVDLSAEYRKLGIKYVRLNDVAWTFDDALNINYVFPRFGADPGQPDNYDFFQTDWYLKSIKSLGIGIIYDLGPTAEYPKLPPRHVDPPKDFDKWAKICVNVINHYNNGWGNGYHYNIKYWEIWNEPDSDHFWTGTPEQYFRLYEIAAKAIKEHDPNIKVGGPALANSLPFLERFLAYCRSHQAPLDFVSWHIYSAEPTAVISKAAKIRALLNKYGFPNTESILDEWSYLPGKWGLLYSNADPAYTEAVAQQIQGVAGAAFDASVLMLLQDSTVDIATFYHGTTVQLWGLFSGYGVPEKTYYTFNAFRLLLDTPDRVATTVSEQSGVTAIAGLSQDKAQSTLLISNFGSQCSHYNITLKSLPWRNGITYEKYILDKNHDLDLVKTETLVGTNIVLPEDVNAPSVCMIRLRANPK